MLKGKLPQIESTLNTTGIFSDIDLHFARFIARFSTDGELGVFLAAALTSRATGNGDICLDLNAAAETVLSDQPEVAKVLKCPPLADWRRTLTTSPAVGKPGHRRPLILDAANRLYLYRYWEYENLLSNIIRQRSKDDLQDFDCGKLKHSLKRLFASEKNDDADWQAIAAVIAVYKRISVITGGPGSGKTYTIARILALLLECVLGGNAKIHLAAPTGKAAARLAESINKAKQALDCSDRIKNTIPNEVHTIHRLLRPVKGTPYFYRNAENPLTADVVVIDEASMVDLALMAKLVLALPPDARLLLIGDKDQLASVEAGSVLGDICDRQVIHGYSNQFLKKIEQVTKVGLNKHLQSATSVSGLQDCIVVLQKSYRCDPQSGIGGLSESINRGDSDAALAQLNDPADQSISWHGGHPLENSACDLKDLIAEGYRKYLTIHDPVLAMEEFNRFKILCALKIGPFGANSINRFAEEVLNQEGLLPPIDRENNQWYRGRPVLITRNDYNLGLFNGDIGVTLPDPTSSSAELYVYFPDSGGDIRRFPTHRLSGYETVYAMTVHKSQGSEFDHIILLLPEKDYPLLTRELIYTGLTRARKTVSIWGPQSVLRAAIARKIRRTSGLRDALWG